MRPKVRYNGGYIDVIYRRKDTSILDITKHYVHKGYIFLMSVVFHKVGTAAMWSTHSLADVQSDLSFNEAKKMFHNDHIRQINKMVKEEIENEPEEFKIKSVEDFTKN